MRRGDGGLAQEAQAEDTLMARYRPHRFRLPTLSLVPLTIEATANYRALDVGSVRGHRTPIMWPPTVAAKVVRGEWPSAYAPIQFKRLTT